MPAREHAAQDWAYDRVSGLTLAETVDLWAGRRGLRNEDISTIARDLIPSDVTMHREIVREVRIGKRTRDGKGAAYVSDIQLIGIARALQIPESDLGVNVNTGDMFRLRSLFAMSGFLPDPGDRRKAEEPISFAERRAAHQGEPDSRWFPVHAAQAA